MNSNKRKDILLGNYKDKDGNLTTCKNFFMGQASEEKPVIKVKGGA